MDGWRDRIRSKVRGQDGARVEEGVEGDGVTTNLLQFTDTKEKEERKGRRGEEEEGESDTTPAILFLSSAATALVAMTTQADDLIAVTFECCSLKEPVTQDRSRQTPHRRGLTVCYMDRKYSCVAAETPRSFNTLCTTALRHNYTNWMGKNSWMSCWWKNTCIQSDDEDLNSR